MFSLICAWTNGWVNNRDAGDFRRHRDHYGFPVMNKKTSTLRNTGPLWGNSPVSGGFPSQRANIFRITDPLWEEFTGHRRVTRSFDVFFDLRLNKRLSKQSRRRWFQTQSRSLWRHCNEQENINAPQYWPFVREFTSDRWIPLTKGHRWPVVSLRKGHRRLVDSPHKLLVMRKAFPCPDVITSSF